MGATIRISDAAHDELRRLAAATDRPLTQLVDQAVELLRRQSFLEGVNRDFARLAEADRAALEAEQRSLDGTLGDGLAPEAWNDPPDQSP